MNELLAQLRTAADNLHTALLVWETHIDHPGARTAIHSAARVLLDAASAMPTHYDDAEVRAQALREAVASLRAKFGPTNRAADYLARTEPIKNSVVPMKNIFRQPYKSASLPYTGTVIACVSK